MSQQVQTVRKSNELIEARYKLTLNEQRLVLSLIAMIRPEDEDFQDYQIHVSDLAEMFGLQADKDLHMKVQESAKELVGKRIELIHDKEKRFVAWFSYVAYKEGKGIIQLRFDKALKPYLLQLKEHFTQFHLNNVVQFKSQYSGRIYELLKRRQNQGNGGKFYITYTLAHIREILGVSPSEYSLFNDFRRFAINPAINEINNYSDLKVVDCEYLKTGRKVTDIKIYAEPKALIILESDKDTTSEAVQALIDFGIGDETAQKWTRKFGKTRVLRNIIYTQTKQKEGQVKNPILYLSKAIEEDYGNGWEDEKQKQKQEMLLALQAAQQKEKEEQEERERQKREKEQAFVTFASLTESEKDALRDMFYSSLTSALKTVWKKAEGKPEEKPMFAVQFITLLKENGVI